MNDFLDAFTYNQNAPRTKYHKGYRDLFDRRLDAILVIDFTLNAGIRAWVIDCGNMILVFQQLIKFCTIDKVSAIEIGVNQYGFFTRLVVK